MKKVIAKQRRIKADIERIIGNFKKDPKTRKTKIYLKNKLEELAEIWKVFQENHTKIEDCDEDEVAKEYFEVELYRIVSELRQDYKITLEEALEEQNDINKGQAIEISLPQINIPKFGGDYNDWASFEDMFTTLIHNNKRLAKVQKLHYLKSNIYNDAESLLKHFTITEANYEPAWELLKNRFNNKRVLIRTQLQILLSQRHLNEDNSTNIRHLLDTTNESLQALRNLNVNVDMWNEILVFIVSERLPEESKRIWEQELGSEKEFPKYKQLKTFLESRFRVLESLENCETFKLTTQPAKVFINTMSRNCRLCDDTHQIYKCPEYVKLNTEAKMDIIKIHKLCINCLKGGHTLMQCRHQLSCFICNKRHHTSVHVESDNSEAIINEASNINFQNESQNRMTPGTSTQNYHTKKASVVQEVLLATAKVKVRSATGLQTNIRVLIDPASQSSFISERVVKVIQGKTKPTSMKITGLQEVPTGLSSRTASIQVESLNSQSKVNVEAYVLNKLTDVLPGKHIQYNKRWNHLKGLVLADPNFSKPEKVDMILGADKAAQILLNGLRIGGEKEPIAQNTIFGWVIFGQTGEKETIQQSSSFYTIAKSCNSYENRRTLSKFKTHYSSNKVKNVNKTNLRTNRREKYFCVDKYSESLTD